MSLKRNILANYASLAHVTNPSIPVGGFLEWGGCFYAPGIFGLVVKALRQAGTFEVRVCVTAQHRQMLDQVLALFAITPDVDLDLMQPGQDLTDLTAQGLLWSLAGSATSVVVGEKLLFYRYISLLAPSYIPMSKPDFSRYRGLAKKLCSLIIVNKPFRHLSSYLFFTFSG